MEELTFIQGIFVGIVIHQVYDILYEILNNRRRK